MKERLNIRRFFRRLWTTFPAATVICALIALLLETIDLMPDQSEEAVGSMLQAAEACACGMCFSVLGSLISRRYSLPGWLCWVFAAAGAAFSLLAGERFGMAYGGIWAAAVLLCFHFAGGRSDRPKRLAQICGSFFSSFGLSFCLFLALWLCFYAVTALFFHGDSGISDHLLVLVFVIPYVLAAPWLFLGRLPDDSDDPDARSGFRKVTAHLFLPFYLILLAILLCYIATIVIRWEMPVGQMNGLALTALCLFAVFHLTLTGEESRISRWFMRWGAWLLLPVIAVQQAGVWMRYQAYGLTPARYAGMLLTILFVLCVVWALLRRRADWFFAGAAVLVLVLLASPVNMEQAARWDQEARLRSALAASSMLDEQGAIIPNENAGEEEKRIILSAADYLSGVKNAPEGSLTHTLQQADGGSYTALFGFGGEEETGWDSISVYGEDTAQRVNVAGYSCAEWYSASFDLDDEQEKASVIVPADQLLAAADWPARELMQKEFKLENGTVFRLTKLTLSMRNGKQQSMRVQGWLLTPEE